MTFAALDYTKNDSLFNMRLFLSTLEKYAEALEYFSNVIQFEPNDSRTMEYFARMYYKLGNLKNYLEWLEELMILKPLDEEVQRRISLVRRKLKP